MSAALSAGQITAIHTVAAEDATAFVNDFDEPFVCAESDWDTTAWRDADGWRKALGSDASREERDAGFVAYSEHLVFETKRLCKEAA